MPPVRVLHVLAKLDRGGVETALVDLLHHSDRNRVAADFMVHTDAPGAYDTEVVGHGARIFVARHPKNPFKQLRSLLWIQKHHGPYDVIHSHVDYFSGFVLTLARFAGFRSRVAHSHTDARIPEASRSRLRSIYVRSMRLLIQIQATAGLAVSNMAAECLFGDSWRSDRRWHVKRNATDLSKFASVPGRDAVRAALGIPPNALVFGHAGRFVPAKNHEFLVDLAAALSKRLPRAHFLFVGSGKLETAIRAKIQRLGLEERFTILAPTGRLPEILLHGMDVFLFPSHFEGLGLALVEAQAAGLRCYISTSIPDEAIAVPELVVKLSLAGGSSGWVSKILQNNGTPPGISQAEAFRRVAELFDVRALAEEMAAFYETIAAQSSPVSSPPLKLVPQ